MAATPAVNWKGVSAVIGLLVTLGGVVFGFTSSHAVIGQKVQTQEKRVDTLETRSNSDGLTIAKLTQQVTDIDENVKKVQEKQDEQSGLLHQIIGKLNQINGRSP